MDPKLRHFARSVWHATEVVRAQHGLDGHVAPINCVSISKDGQFLVSGAGSAVDKDNTVR